MIYMSSIIFDTDLSIIHFRYPIHFYDQKGYGVVTQKNYKITKNKKPKLNTKKYIKKIEKKC